MTTEGRLWNAHNATFGCIHVTTDGMFWRRGSGELVPSEATEGRLLDDAWFTGACFGSAHVTTDGMCANDLFCCLDASIVVAL